MNHILLNKASFKDIPSDVLLIRYILMSWFGWGMLLKMLTFKHFSIDTRFLCIFLFNETAYRLAMDKFIQ